MKNIFKKEFFKRDITLAIVSAFCLSVCLSFAGFELRCQDLRENILRLHILANSDSDADQSVKLKVRDRLLYETEKIYSTAKTKEEAAEITNNNIEFLKSVAEEVLKDEGFNYGAEISVGDAYFETREYENFTLPAGNYQAVRVLLGDAKGKNWWCVMFPSLCIPAAGNQHSLDEAVGENSAEIAENPTKFKMEFKMVEIFENIKHYFN